MKVTTTCQFSLLMMFLIVITKVAAQEGPGTVIARPGQDIELLCNITGGVQSWRVNGTTYTSNQLLMGELAGHNNSLTGPNIIIEDVMMNDNRNGSIYICVIPQTPPAQDIESDPTILLVAGVPAMVPNVRCDNITSLNLTLSWGEPFNNLDPIVNYTVSCSGDVTFPPTTIDSTTRSYTITNLTPMTTYTCSVVATNSIGSGEAGKMNCTTLAIVTGLENSMYSFGEDVGQAQCVVVISDPLSMEANVTVFTTDGTATGGSTIGEGVDYVSGPYIVTFPSGMTVMPFDIPINDDTIIENNENFALTIDPSSLPTGVIVGSRDQATVTVVDNDAIAAFSDSVYRFGEDVGSARPVLVISNRLSMNFNVTVFTTDGTATGGSTIGEGVDYASGPYNVTFPSGMTRMSFGIPINDDAIIENNETFALNIDPSSLPTGVIVGSRDQATVTIVDNDASGPGSTSSVVVIIIIVVCIIAGVIVSLAGIAAAYLHVKSKLENDDYAGNKTVICMWVLFIASLGLGFIFLGIYLCCRRYYCRKRKDVLPDKVEMTGQSDLYASPKKINQGDTDNKATQDLYSYARTGPINVVVPGGKP